MNRVVVRRANHRSNYRGTIRSVWQRILEPVVVALCLFSVILFAANASAFEVLTEGAMGRVSAVSTDNVEDLVNINGAPAAGITEDTDYEQLPFDVSVSLEGEEAPDFKSELDQAVTNEVELWAEKLRERNGDDIGTQITFTDDIGVSLTPDQVSSIVNDIRAVESPEDTEFSKTSFVLQNSKVQVETTILEPNHIIVNIQSEVDRVSSIDMRHNSDSAILGSAYITGINASSTLEISAGANRARMNEDILRALGR